MLELRRRAVGFEVARVNCGKLLSNETIRNRGGVARCHLWLIHTSVGYRISDGFTPMSLTMDLAKKTVEICAYTDCWRGALTTISSGKSLVAARADALRPQQTQSERENIALIIDKEHSAAAFAGFGMLTPM